MNYDQIRTFLTVVSYGNITAAADHLFVSQSTVSDRLKSLEEELGTTLLIRQKGHRTIALTQAGNTFINLASQWASLYKDTQALKNNADITTLGIAAVDAVNTSTFASLYNSHLEIYPKIRLSVMTFHSNEIHELVESRTADIGFVFSRVQYPDVISQPVYRELMYLLCRSDSPYHNEISCEELKPENEIFLNWGSDFSQWHDLHWNRSSLPLIQVNTGSMIHAYLTSKKRWSIAPMSVIDALKDCPDVTYYTLASPPEPRICYMLENRNPNPSHVEAIAIFKKELKEYIEASDSICSFKEWMLQGKKS